MVHFQEWRCHGTVVDVYQALKDAYGAGHSTAQRSTFIVYRYVRCILRAVTGDRLWPFSYGTNSGPTRLELKQFSMLCVAC